MDHSAVPITVDFDEPPVVETVLSAQFEKLHSFRTVHFGLFWERVRSAFPQSQQQGALEPAFEYFGAQTPPFREFSLYSRATPRHSVFS